jgi:RimJ/RimL family protein N-acetyltransferase
LARSTLGLVARWLLREASLERIQLRTETGNERMLAAAQAAGFHYEGVLRGYVRERGERVDNAVLSMVRRDMTG